MKELLVLDMPFPKRLSAERKKQGLTQKHLADRTGVKVLQIHRYESGSSQPTLDVIRKIALALSVSTDDLIFDKNERGPTDDLKLLFEAASRLDLDEKRVVKELIESMLIKHEAKKWTR